MRNLNGVGVFPSRSIDNNAYQTARDDTTQGQLEVRLLAIQLSRSIEFWTYGNNPTAIDPENHTPVDSFPGSWTKTNTNSSTSDTLCGGDGKLWEGNCEPGAYQDCGEEEKQVNQSET